MTLNTEIAVRGAIEPAELLQLAIKAVCEAADEPKRIATAQVDDRASYYGDDDKVRLAESVCGQGLPAWVQVRYRTDGPLYAKDEYDHEIGEEPYFVAPACDLHLSFDTAYSYHGRNGANCSQLHLAAILNLAEALDGRCKLIWQNEYSGDWYYGLHDQDEELARQEIQEFLGHGDESVAWFTGVVRPLIDKLGFEEA